MKRTVLAVVILIALGVLYYGLSPLLRNTTLDEELPTVTVPAATSTEMTAASEPAPIVDTPTHPASGTARIVEGEDGLYLRYENFKTINGPDLYVYLSKDPNARDFVDLGRLKATEGNINYAIPEGVDPREYPYALVWCKAFGVLFNSAKLY